MKFAVDKRRFGCYNKFRFKNIGELCNGSTTDSDSVCWGSNPYSPGKTKDHPRGGLLFLLRFFMGFEQGGSLDRKAVEGACLRETVETLTKLWYDDMRVEILGD